MTDEQCVAMMAATIFMQVGGFTPEECAMEACDLFSAVQLERKRRFIAPMGHDLSEEDGNA